MNGWRRAWRAWWALPTRARVATLVVIVVVAAVVELTGGAPPDGEVAAPVVSRSPSPTPSPSRTASATEPASPASPRGDGALALRTGRVTNVVDGDTLDLADGTRVRLAIVDTPEVHGGVEPCGREASAFTADLVLGEQVTVWRPSTAPVTDPYDRLLGEVVRGDGTSLNVALAAAGLGTVDERYASEDPDLAARARAAQADALAPACAPAAAPPRPSESSSGPVPSCRTTPGDPHCP